MTQMVVVGTASALLSVSTFADAAPRSPAVTWDCTAVSHAAEELVRLRVGVDPLRCTVSGDGLCFYHVGNNEVTLCVVDDENETVESIEAEDVCVSLCVEGAIVAHVVMGAPGIVELVYHMPEGSVDPVTVGMSVCGLALHGSPWTVQLGLAGNSAVLAAAPSERVTAFLRELTSEWLPGRAYSLLYRGSRDGMTAQAFHGLCDGKGPTLVLIRCNTGCVFGGYAGASWESHHGPIGLHVASPDSIVLSVVGPHKPAPVRFPVVSAAKALMCHFAYGPVFYGGLYVTAKGLPPSPEGEFCSHSFCGFGYGDYQDVLGKGNKSLTGTRLFCPVEIEVFAVTPQTLA